MPVLIIGRNGTLGRAFARVCEDRSISFHLLSREECDLCSLESVEKALNKYKPWAVINAAGFVRVDDAEKEFEKCFYDNTVGPENLAVAAVRHGIKLVTFSSDLVFDGKKGKPYIETDLTAPLNIYGQSKVQSEEIVSQANPEALIIRTSAFFSPWDNYNFAHYVTQSLLAEEVITPAKDVRISPTFVPDLVNATLDLLVDDESGIWHLSNQGEISWSDFAYEIADRLDLPRKYISGVENHELNLPAERPSYTVLSSNRGILLPSLESALQRYADEKRATVEREKHAMQKAIA